MMREGQDSKPKLCHATVIFGDIRGFTSFASKHPPGRVIHLLDRHLENQIRLVFDEEGTIDKFLGDGIMAIFGAPQALDNAELRAVRAAWRMREASCQPVRDEEGNEYVLRSGFGIATGPFVLGFVGSRRLSSLTTIGDTVNLAARLQGVTGDADIIIDRTTYEKVKEFVEVESLGQVTLKGKENEIIHCWRVTALKDASGE
jgi:adenylate cyclase